MCERDGKCVQDPPVPQEVLCEIRQISLAALIFRVQCLIGFGDKNEMIR